MNVFRGGRLKTARERRGLTQDELAERAQTTQLSISRYENSKSTPAPDILAALALALEVSADWLLGLTDSPDGHLQAAELTPDEWQALAAFRRANLEELVRVFLESKQHQPGDRVSTPDDQ